MDMENVDFKLSHNDGAPVSPTRFVWDSEEQRLVAFFNTAQSENSMQLYFFPNGDIKAHYNGTGNNNFVLTF